ncbi:MAG: hypothetical protein Ta2B_21230 [Termitinemataceae bacterium]|nr:MAG: hypothetical protein Ta2B_21230 [Termitinemataceae bacterium]
MKKLELPSVTLAAISGVKIFSTIQALKYSMRCIKFGDAIFITNKKPLCIPKNIRFEYAKIKTINDYNYLVMYDLHKFIQTQYVLIVHYDGFIINPHKWQNSFLDYDYIGAPWPKERQIFDANGNLVQVGNGVGLRSKRLLEIASALKLPFEPYDGLYSEDSLICIKYRHLFEQNGIKFAPVEMAEHFSHEQYAPKNITPFMFHDFKYKRIDRFIWFAHLPVIAEIGRSIWFVHLPALAKKSIRLFLWFVPPVIYKLPAKIWSIFKYMRNKK